MSVGEHLADSRRPLPPRAAVSRADRAMSGSSMVPSTCEWLARICSIRVEPERGRPTMKMGARSAAPAGSRSKRLGLKQGHGPLRPPAWSRPRHTEARTPKARAFQVVVNGGPVALVLERLAERVVEVQPVVVAELAAAELRLHGRDFLGLEPARLEVGEAPPGFAETRRQLRGSCDRRRWPSLATAGGRSAWP